MPKFELHKTKLNTFYFELTSANGVVIMQSNLYRTKANALNGIKSIQTNAPIAKTIDFT